MNEIQGWNEMTKNNDIFNPKKYRWLLTTYDLWIYKKIKNMTQNSFNYIFYIYSTNQSCLKYFCYILLFKSQNSRLLGVN